MFYGAIPGYGGRYFGSQRIALGRKLRVGQSLACNLRQLAQGSDRKQICRNEEGIDTGVVRGPEHGTDHAVGPDRISVAREHQRVSRRLSRTLKVIGPAARFALLFAEGSDDGPGCLFPGCVESGGAAGCAPVGVSQPDRIAERIDLPFALAHARVHVGLVVERPGERRVGGAPHKCIGIRVEQDQVRLPPDDAFEQPGQGRVLLCEGKIRHHLRGGVAQPHGVDVAGYHEGVRLPI